MTRTRRTHHPSAHWLSLILAGLIGIAGYFGPWAPHRAAGLVITGLDLAEYVKFLPQVASGEIAVRREIFYFPLLAASLSASLLANRRELRPWIRFALALAAISLALAMLPPAWNPTTLRLPEYRLQISAIAVCLAALPVSLITRYLPNGVILALVALLALAATILPAQDFLRVRPAILDLYRSSLPLGWGFWTCIGGNLLLMLTAIAEMIRRLPTRRFRA
ncbi:MAG: hypothetical protein CVU38_09230 [Chloroflexi bacterium HGW-Chloroflexi-1]|nr:MAG: hypothetical protein CVU38_09230 [Chloroflexi bacterium HGW-Chloroflexi-1]